MDFKYPELSIAGIVVWTIGMASAIGYVMPTFPRVEDLAAAASVVRTVDPRCEMSLSKYAVNQGDAVMLSWKSENAMFGLLGDEQVASYGSTTLHPLISSVYTLFVFNEKGQFATCTTGVEVK